MPTLPPGAKMAVIEGTLNEVRPFTLRLKLPTNHEIPALWHPWIERNTRDRLEPQKWIARRATSFSNPQRGSLSFNSHGFGVVLDRGREKTIRRTASQPHKLRTPSRLCGLPHQFVTWIVHKHYR
jgi:hypothetical protein